MRHGFAVLITAVLTLLCAQAAGKPYTVSTVPNVQKEDSRRMVSDPDGILSDQARMCIDTLLCSIRAEGRGQIAVVALNSIGDSDPREFIHELFNSWGIGSEKADNGLMVLLVTDQGAIEMETGYGMEGYLPDAICKRIIMNVMIPRFSQGDFDGGMTQGMISVASILRGIPADEIVPEEGFHEEEVLAPLMFMLMIVLVIAFVQRRFHRCPRCKGSNMLRRVRRECVSATSSMIVYRSLYRCRRCGYETWRTETCILDSGTGHGSSGGWGGGFSSGGFSGGGWGGGHSGGGGAGGRF